MTISLIAAIDLDQIIGKDNKLPWKMPADLRHFRAVTLGKPVIMGRKTFESIGKPLRHRHNIVVSRRPDFGPAGCQCAHTLDSALSLALSHGNEAMVIGGAVLFAEALARSSRLYITVIEARFGGDARFPVLSAHEWALGTRESHSADPENPHPYHFLVLQRIAAPKESPTGVPAADTLEPADLLAVEPRSD